MSRQDTLKRLEAIGRLAIARGSQADEGQLDIYADGLKDMDADLVVAACRSLGLVERAEFEGALPSLGSIRRRVGIEREEAREREQRKHMLPMPVQPVLTEAEREAQTKRGAEMRDKFLADLRAMIRSKRMPKAHDEAAS